LATCIGQIAAAIYWGPTSVPKGIRRCEELLSDATIGPTDRAAVIPYFGGLHAQLGAVSHGRELVAEATTIYQDLGARHQGIHVGTVSADIELLAGDLDAAERTLREQCEFFQRERDTAHLAVRAAKLAETMYRQGDVAEAARWATVSRANAASDDLSAQLILGAVEAKLLAKSGSVSRARDLAEEVGRAADGTDGLNQTAATRLALAEVLRIAELDVEADGAIEEAIELFERKGNIMGISHARELLALGAPAA
jgi:hypothetical protein